MSELKMGIGKSDEWYTPKFIFDSIGIEFDLDPCSPPNGSNVPCRKFYTKDDNGLLNPWQGCVFMNPPFGGRNGHVPWLRKFVEHGNGIALVRAHTSSGWFHEFAPKMDGVLFPRGKTKFIKQNGEIGKSPSSGVVLMAIGDCKEELRKSGLGIYYEEKK